jgi:hypothetical protein
MTLYCKLNCASVDFFYPSFPFLPGAVTDAPDVIPEPEPTVSPNTTVVIRKRIRRKQSPPDVWKK